MYTEAASSGSGDLVPSQQFVDLAVENVLLLGPEVGEAERLQVSGSAPHRKQHCSAGLNNARPNGNFEIDPNPLFQVDGKIEQSTGQRDALQLGGNLPVVLELHHRKHRLR